jgi:uncharacterized protein YgiM (DUF1202 family)
MKYRVIAAVLGSVMVLASVTGCSASKSGETEPQTIEILDMEIVGETEHVTESSTREQMEETESDANTIEEPETLEITVEIESDTEAVQTDETSIETSETDSEMAEEETREASMPETALDAASRTKTQSGNEMPEEQSGYADEEEAQTQSASEVNLAVVNDRVNVRTEASTSSEVQALLEPGCMVIVLSSEEDWAQISYESEEGIVSGYVKNEYLSAIENLYLATESVNLRSQPYADSERLGTLEEGALVPVIRQSGVWSEVITRSEEETAIDAYVKSEFLASVSQSVSNVNIINEFWKLGGSFTEKSGEQAAEETEAESETATETEAAVERETAADASAESEGTDENAESEVAAETDVNEESETVTETDAKSESVIETDVNDENETEGETDVERETAGETETAAENETASEPSEVAESEHALETEQSSETSQETAETPYVTWGYEVAEAQFSLAQELVPELAALGILYTDGDATSADHADILREIASASGTELRTMTMIDETDIDFAASQLVGNVDAIILLDDAVVDGLIDTVTAYADEVGIPVIGFTADQIVNGCAAAADGSKRYFGRAELEKLGISIDLEENDQVVVYE